jgi:AraC-like DNA-binding protein
VAGTIRAAALTGFEELCRTLGLDPLRMLDSVGLPRAALTDPDLRISTSAGRDLLEACSRVAEDFALRLSELRTPSIMGPVALIIREQPTARGVLEAFGRYMSLHADSTRLSVEETDDVAIVYVTQSFDTPGPMRQSNELAMAQVVRVLRRYLGPTWRPQSISFVHSAPKSLATHRRLFGPNIYFDRDFNTVVFDRTDLDRPNPIADPAMAREIERYVGKLAGSAQAPLPERVSDTIRALLSTGRGTVELVAQQMGLDPRTLQRQLAAQGMSFIDLLQEVRMDLTGPYLEDSDRPLAEVAELLGFSALSAFSRWHRTHYGRSASDRRKVARSKDGHAGPPSTAAP